MNFFASTFLINGHSSANCSLHLLEEFDRLYYHFVPIYVNNFLPGFYNILN